MSRFITFEGPEGAGKTTQIRLVKNYLEEQGYTVLVVREPGGTKIGDQIRQILLNPDSSDIRMRTEILLYAASRAQLVDEKILPSLKQGKIVLCDRYIDSSVAYQGYGADWEIHEVLSVNRTATGGFLPDRTYLLDVPITVGQERIGIRGTAKDRMEQKDLQFHQQVRQGYLQIAAKDPKRIKVISGEQEVQQVYQQIIEDLQQILEKHT